MINTQKKWKIRNTLRIDDDDTPYSVLRTPPRNLYNQYWNMIKHQKAKGGCRVPWCKRQASDCCWSLAHSHGIRNSIKPRWEPRRQKWKRPDNRLRLVTVFLGFCWVTQASLVQFVVSGFYNKAWLISWSRQVSLGLNTKTGCPPTPVSTCLSSPFYRFFCVCVWVTSWTNQ